MCEMTTATGWVFTHLQLISIIIIIITYSLHGAESFLRS
jgi:hypothetical protein